MAYSDFKAQLYAGRVREAEISPTELRGQYEDQRAAAGMHSFVSARVEDPELLKTLEAKGVRFTGRKGAGVPELLLSWALPVVAMTWLWRVMARRMGMGGRGILADRRACAGSSGRTEARGGCGGRAPGKGGDRAEEMGRILAESASTRSGTPPALRAGGGP